MKLASLGLMALVVVLTFAILAADTWSALRSGMSRAPEQYSNRWLVKPPSSERDRPDRWPQQRPLLHEQFAIVPITGRELIDAMLADSSNESADGLPRSPDTRTARTPEGQARGLSGSA